VLQL
jgi:hypothetical protein